MHRLRLPRLAPCLLVTATLACGDSSGGEGNDEAGTETAGSSDTGADSSESSSGSGDESGTTDDGCPGPEGCDVTDSSGTQDTGSTGTDSESTGSTETGSTETGSDTDTGSESGSTGTGTGSDTDTGGTDMGMDTSTDGGNCLPEEIACDGMDEDCNGIVDDLDVGNDGFCDCYSYGIIGNKGSNPAANFEAWLEDKGATAVRFGTAPDHVLTAEDLAPYDILIVDRLTHSYSAAERDLLQAWLEDGHGMITMAGYTNSQIDVDQQNSLATASGLAYAPPIYLNPVEVWQNHPVAEGAGAVQVYGGWQVVGPGEVFVRPQNEPNTSLGTAVTFTDSGAIVFSDEWISFDSEWQAIPEVEVFWSNMIDYVGPKTLCVLPQ